MAAWLHDIGHTKNYTDHETESQLIALELLCIAGMPEEETALIIGCIGATRMPQRPKNKLEAVLCDADLAHLASIHFFDRSDLLRQEWDTILDKQYTDDGWLESCLQFLATHRYHTPYGQSVLRRRKAQNICRLMSWGYPLAA